MDRVIALNALFAIADYKYYRSAVWVLLLVAPLPRIRVGIYAVAHFACIALAAAPAYHQYFSSVLPIAVAIATKWIFPP